MTENANIHSLPVDGKRDIFKVVSGKMYINLYPSGHLVIHAPSGADGLRPVRYKKEVGVVMMYQEEYKRWLGADLEDADLRPELSKIEGNEEEIKERFAVALKFGTAGLRGVLGEIGRASCRERV